MSEKYLHRDDAPFGVNIWEKIDETVVAAAKTQLAAIILGQDLMTAFAGPSGNEYQFTVSESIALNVIEAGSICILKK